MVKPFICIAMAGCILLFHPLAIQAHQHERPKPRTVTGIQITEVGKSDDDNDELEKKYCKAFKPSRSEVKRFFLNAYAVPAKMGAHDRYSPCYAKGSVEFSDNTRGKWKLSSSGNGTLFWDTGDVAHLFHRGYRWNDPFACTYGPTSEGEC